MEATYDRPPLTPIMGEQTTVLDINQMEFEEPDPLMELGLYDFSEPPLAPQQKKRYKAPVQSFGSVPPQVSLDAVISETGQSGAEQQLLLQPHEFAQLGSNATWFDLGFDDLLNMREEAIEEAGQASPTSGTPDMTGPATEDVEALEESRRLFPVTDDDEPRGPARESSRRKATQQRPSAKRKTRESTDVASPVSSSSTSTSTSTSTRSMTSKRPQPSSGPPPPASPAKAPQEKKTRKRAETPEKLVPDMVTPSDPIPIAKTAQDVANCVVTGKCNIPIDQNGVGPAKGESLGVAMFAGLASSLSDSWYLLLGMSVPRGFFRELTRVYHRTLNLAVTGVAQKVDLKRPGTLLVGTKKDTQDLPWFEWTGEAFEPNQKMRALLTPNPKVAWNLWASGVLRPPSGAKAWRARAKQVVEGLPEAEAQRGVYMTTAFAEPISIVDPFRSGAPLTDTVAILTTLIPLGLYYGWWKQKTQQTGNLRMAFVFSKTQPFPYITMDMYDAMRATTRYQQELTAIAQEFTYHKQPTMTWATIDDALRTMVESETEPKTRLDAYMMDTFGAVRVAPEANTYMYYATGPVLTTLVEKVAWVGRTAKNDPEPLQGQTVTIDSRKTAARMKKLRLEVPVKQPLDETFNRDDKIAYRAHTFARHI